MKYLPLTLALILVLMGGATTHAASVKTGSTFFIPVQFERGPESINAIEGSIRIPEGITVERINTADSALQMFAHGPTYDLSQGTIEFTGGTPQGIIETSGVLFVIEARADAAGIYTFIAKSVSAFQNNGEGTQVGIEVPAVTVTVLDDGDVEERVTGDASTELVTAIGQEDSLFEGKWFVTFYGGASHSTVHHYEVKEGWFGHAVPAERYYPLEEQNRSSTVWVTAVSDNGEKTTVRITPANPWPERFLLAGVVALFLGVCLALYLIVLRKKNH